MTFEELIADLKQKGLDENSIQFAINCFHYGMEHERAECCYLLRDWNKVNWNNWDCANAIEERGNRGRN